MESSLTIPKYELELAIGSFLGFVPPEAVATDAVWTERKLAIVRELVKSTLRRFYFNAVILESGAVHSWTFLKPFANLTLLEGAQTVDLPDDFARVEGRIVVSSSSNTNWQPVDIYGEPFVAQQYAMNSDATGAPQYAAIREVKGTSLTESNRKKLFVYPAADQDWTVSFAYSILPNCLTGDHPYAYGGAQHAETLKAGALAAAEFYQDNGRGVCESYYQEMLSTSISADRKASPHVFGPNRDTSDILYWRRRGLRDQGLLVNTITINGLTPT